MGIYVSDFLGKIARSGIAIAYAWCVCNFIREALSFCFAITALYVSSSCSASLSMVGIVRSFNFSSSVKGSNIT